MDVDYDGAAGGNDRCSDDLAGQSYISFTGNLEQYNIKNVKDPNPVIHHYLVFENSNDGGPKGYKTLNPMKYGVQPLSFIAVVTCFGQSFNTNNDHDENDVLYVAFVGKDAVPGAEAAKWAAKSFEEDILLLDCVVKAGMRLLPEAQLPLLKHFYVMEAEPAKNKDKH
ncbi:hypothetical protein F5Y10DRAFT_292573 [Nemania abortiva]|nr:hypothetical protein F5Y10DRAFT_292573 [Nemania abortiva]